MVNPQEAGGPKKNTNFNKVQAFIMQEWAAISQDVAQKLIDRMPGRIAEVLKKKTANIDSLHELNVIVNKTLWHLWNACNYTSVYHSNIWQKDLKTLKQQTLGKPILVSFSKLLATAIQLENKMVLAWRLICQGASTPEFQREWKMVIWLVYCNLHPKTPLIDEENKYQKL